MTVYIAETERRSGVGHTLYSALIPILQRQGFHSAFAGISLPNPDSVGLHEKMGFVHIGTFPDVGYKHGAWHDVGYWPFELNAQTSTPSEPQPFPAFDPRH